MHGTILQQIVETKRREVEAARSVQSLAEARRRAQASPPARDFYRAVSAGKPIALIGEIKRQSPSAGLIRANFDPAALARDYHAAGAAALSVLTDAVYFGGRLEHIAVARTAAPVPVLRKDFVIDEQQIFESRAAGADAVLLIAGLLTVGQFDAWSRLACKLGMSALIEVHTEDELRRALPCCEPARRSILGINNRDLARQAVDLNTGIRLAALLPAGTPFVAESGIRSHEDAARLEAAGATAMLVGESLMRSADVAAAARALLRRM